MNTANGREILSFSRPFLLLETASFVFFRMEVELLVGIFLQPLRVQ